MKLTNLYSSTEKRRLMIFDISSPPEYRDAIFLAKSFNLNDHSRQNVAFSAISRENRLPISRFASKLYLFAEGGVSSSVTIICV